MIFSPALLRCLCAPIPNFRIIFAPSYKAKRPRRVGAEMLSGIAANAEAPLGTEDRLDGLRHSISRRSRESTTLRISGGMALVSRKLIPAAMTKSLIALKYWL